MANRMSGANGVFEVDDRDQCLLSDQELLQLVKPDACGFMHKKSSVTGWYRYWFSLKGSRFFIFERERGKRRGILVNEIGLFCCQIAVATSPKRRLEIDVVDSTGKLHVLRAANESELRWWLHALRKARQTTPPAKPFLKPKEGSFAPVPLEKHVKVDHIMFVVHGIGSEVDRFTKNVGSLQDNYSEILSKVFPDLAFETEFLTVHWRDKLRELEVQKTLLRVVPRVEEKNPMRSFLIEKGTDLMYYGIEKYRRFMLREVCQQMNIQYQEFRKKFPDFEGQISICAHSLGSVLCYELLARKLTDDLALLKQENLHLDFGVTHMFCVGSPLAQFANVDDHLRPTIRTLLRRNGPQPNVDLPIIYNIFHAHDPVALRLEPLVGADLEEIAPLSVPHWKTMSRRESTVRWLGSILGRKDKQRRHQRDASSAQFDEEFAIPNPRIDLTLQVATTMEEMSTVYSALKSHVDYWQSRDLMLLMMSKLLKAKISASGVVVQMQSPQEKPAESTDSDGPPAQDDDAQGEANIRQAVDCFIERLVQEAAWAASTTNATTIRGVSEPTKSPLLETAAKARASAVPPRGKERLTNAGSDKMVHPPDGSTSADLGWMDYIFGTK